MIRRILAFLSLLLISPGTMAGQSQPTVAISLEIPPYVMANATKGLEVDIMRLALADDSLSFVQMPYADLQAAVQRGRADISAGVRQTDDAEVFYSEPFITFENAAISKKSDHLEIADIADLGDHQVLTWQGADRELGGAFERLFAPDSPHRVNYVEVPDQKEQVRRFWEGAGSVAVIDLSIFAYFTKELGHTMAEVDVHRLFPPVTDFRVAFKDHNLRDAFNLRLAELCRSGAYEALLERYNVILQKTVCDTE